MSWTKEELKKAWERFAEKNDFMLNPKTEMVDMLADGVMSNEKNFGYKFCPCRVRDGTKETDIGLLCPCNFKIHSTWASQGRCWCGLFVKR
ncbi:TPA: ferredoxin-thioredoxin reductase [Candidatus Woesearchaeota archaeon]|nr:ferredoxin-thioredoxin reductase [Candidatus Woesearchaeota archaeon]